MDRLTLNAARAGECVAFVTSERPKSFAWTELGIYALTSREDGQTFACVIIGKSLRDGEVDRVKLCGFPSLARALGWSEFDHDSRLFASLRQKAIDWIEGMAREGASRRVVDANFGSVIEAPKTRRYGKVEVDLRFAGGPEAIAEPHTISVTWFNEDGRVVARTNGSFSRQYGGAKISAELPENVR